MSLALEAQKARVLVLGGGYAGVLAAIRVARKAGRRAEVTLVNDRSDFVERIRLHQLAVGQKLPVRPIERMLRGTGATLVIGRIVRIDAERKRVAIQSAEGARELAYDVMIFALGSGRADTEVPGVNEHAHDIASEAGA